MPAIWPLGGQNGHQPAIAEQAQFMSTRPNGLPVYLALTPGEAHDNRLCSVLLSALLPQTMLLADRGYDANWIRELARQQGAWANIPPKRNRKDPICFSPYLYRARNLIERFFSKIKQCRRVATRYDKLAANYLAFIKLASIRIWLRASEFRALAIAEPIGPVLRKNKGRQVSQLLGRHAGTTAPPGIYDCRDGRSDTEQDRAPNRSAPRPVPRRQAKSRRPSPSP